MTNNSLNLISPLVLLVQVAFRRLFIRRTQRDLLRLASSPQDRQWRRTPVRNITSMPTRISMVRYLRDGNVELILLVGRTMLITIHAVLHGIVPPRTKL